MTWRVWVQTSPSGCHCGSWGQSIKASSSGKWPTHPVARRKSRPREIFLPLSRSLRHSSNTRSGARPSKGIGPAQLERLGRRLELEARHQLHPSQHAQRVLDEALRGVAQQPPLEVAAAAERVLELTGREVDRHRVDGEVAAARRVGDRHRRIGGDLEVAVPGAGLALAPRQRDVDGVMTQLEDGERLAHLVDAPLLLEQRPQAARLDAEHLEVELLIGIDRQAQQRIADRAADQESAAARIAHAPIDPPRQVEERRVEGAEIDVHFD